ncbi:hypothetical protein [Parasitella parasitica]|uniref:Uncharacterized protein n=1 Tax=Parasitella parasitica TaxID=35722 RepID=A0A0B7NEI9_9FUNG|nr:hypothetical protein [Parasitella parasitica]
MLDIPNNSFWALLLNHTQRNVIYRMIHHRIPTGTIPLTPTVPFSSQSLIQEYFWPGTSIDLVKQGIRTLNFERIPVRLDSPTAFELLVIFVLALAEVWKAHWRFIFDNTTVSTDSLYASFQRALAKRQAEDNLPSSAG